MAFEDKDNFFNEAATRQLWENKDGWKSRKGSGHGMTVPVLLASGERKTYSAGTLSAMLKASVNPKNEKYTPHDTNLLMDALNSHTFNKGEQHATVKDVKAQINPNGSMS